MHLASCAHKKTGQIPTPKKCGFDARKSHNISTPRISNCTAPWRAGVIVKQQERSLRNFDQLIVPRFETRYSYVTHSLRKYGSASSSGILPLSTTIHDLSGRCAAEDVLCIGTLRQHDTLCEMVSGPFPRAVVSLSHKSSQTSTSHAHSLIRSLVRRQTSRDLVRNHNRTKYVYGSDDVRVPQRPRAQAKLNLQARLLITGGTSRTAG